MKLSPRTLDVIESIHKLSGKPLTGACFQMGNVIKARKNKGMPILRAEIAESFPQDFAIYDLKKFLSMWQLLDDPELIFEEDKLVFKSGRHKASIKYAKADFIEDPEFFTKNVALPSRDFSFDLTEEDFKRVKIAASNFGMPEIAFIGEDGQLKITTYRSDVSSFDKYEIVVGETDRNFKLIMGIDNLQMPRRDYKVTASYAKIIEFSSDSEGLDTKFWFTCSAKSVIE